MIYRSDYPDVPLRDEPVHQAVLAASVREYADQTAFLDDSDGSVVTYAELDAHSRGIAAALAASGLQAGDVLTLHSSNTLAFPAAFYGALRAGAVVSTASPLFTAAELARQFADSGARWLVTASPLLDVARAAARSAGGVEEILLLDHADGHRSVLDLRDTNGPEPEVHVDPARDTAVLPYSSGTTGLPKGVQLTHRNVATNAVQQLALLPLTPADTLLAVVPWWHIYGQSSLLHAPLMCGARVILTPPQFDLRTFLSAIERHRATVLYIAPPIAHGLATLPAVDEFDLGSVQMVLSGAAALDPDLAAACAERLDIPRIGQAYGMTELSPGTHAVPRHAAAVPPGTAGKLAPSTEMRITSLDDGHDLGPGEDGELLFRGPQVMKGYLGRPTDTDTVTDADGWLHTGDVGRVDDDGWLYITDRVKELIKYKGHQVAPAELEAVLLTHPAIADAAVIGVPDETGGEIPKAFVVPQPAACGQLDETAIMRYVADRVAPYKKIRRVALTDTLPRSSSGKILRRILRAAEADE